MASTATNSTDVKETITLSNFAKKGLALPGNSGQFINERYAGKIEELYSYNGNAEALYTVNYDGKYYTGQFSERIDNNDYIIGNKFKSALTDAEFITKFLETSKGTKFLTRQFLLQGYQPFDETKLYNPASPILAAAEPGLWGLLDHPVRHIDTSDVIDGVIDGVGLGTVKNTISDVASVITGTNYETAPTPPRSSVASEASSGLSVNTATSLLGAGSKVDQVMSPLARDSVKGLLRGGTATDAYTSPRYSRITTASGGSILSNLANKALSYVASKTAVGSLVNPTQPWDAKYRADEKTYDFYLTSYDLFYPQNNDHVTTIAEGVIGSLGFSKVLSFNSQAIPQRFHAAFNEENLTFKGSVFRHSEDSFINYLADKYNNVLAKNTLERTSDTSVKFTDGNSILSSLNVNINPIGLLSTNNDSPSTKFVYTDLINRTNNSEFSDVLYEYKNFINANSNISDQTNILRVAGKEEVTSNQKLFVNTVGIETENNIDLLKKNKEFYSQNNNVKKYQTTSSVDDTTKSIKSIYDKTLNNPDFISLNRYPIKNLFSDPDQVDQTVYEDTANSINNNGGNESAYKIENISGIRPQQFRGDNLGFSYLSTKSKNENYTKLVEDSKFPTINLTQNDRSIGGSYKPNYVNTLDPLKDTEFEKNYSEKNEYNGPDLIKFYFYDIVNKYYIPFSAIITNLTENNQADWQRIDYIGRADKLFHYGGFSRTLNLSFKIYIGSLKELLPTWKRLNYLVSMTRPANYSDTVKGGAIVPPMMQLTLGDIYKNHFIILNSINLAIPSDAVWEIVPESKKEGWEYGIYQKIKAKDDIHYAQFPREVDVSCQISILEKDRPMVGHAIWGDAPFKFGTTTETESYSRYKTTSGLGRYNVSMLTGEVTDVQSVMTSSLKETFTLTGYYENQEYFEPYESRDFSNNLVTQVNDKKATRIEKDYKGEVYIQEFNTNYGNLENTTTYEYNKQGYAILDSNGDPTKIDNLEFGVDQQNNFNDMNVERDRFLQEVANHDYVQ